MHTFLLRWKNIFSTGIIDLGNCDLVQHEINLSVETHFKDKNIRIPPALFQEVRENLKEMFAAGAIRHFIECRCSKKERWLQSLLCGP